jgi:hypothetical protein
MLWLNIDVYVYSNRCLSVSQPLLCLYVSNFALPIAIATSRSRMPPKAMPMQHPVPVQDTLGMNPDYMLPHQREQLRRNLQNISELQNRKAKEPNNPSLDTLISEARSSLSQLAALVQMNEKQYPTREAFQDFVAKSMQSRGGGQHTQDLRTLRMKHSSVAQRLKELDEILAKGNLNDEQREKFRQEQMLYTQQMEHIKDLLRNVQRISPPMEYFFLT